MSMKKVLVHERGKEFLIEAKNEASRTRRESQKRRELRYNGNTFQTNQKHFTISNPLRNRKKVSNGQKQMTRVTEEEFDLSNLSTQLSKVVDTNEKLLEELEREHQLLLELRMNREIVEREFLGLKTRLESTRNGIAEQDKIHSLISKQREIREYFREISDGLEDSRSPDTTNCDENSKSNPAWKIFSDTEISSTVRKACFQKNMTNRSRQRSRPHCPRKSNRI